MAGVIAPAPPFSPTMPRILNGRVAVVADVAAREQTLMPTRELELPLVPVVMSMFWPMLATVMAVPTICAWNTMKGSVSTKA
jgi:hypothetical protein